MHIRLVKPRNNKGKHTCRCSDLTFVGDGCNSNINLKTNCPRRIWSHARSSWPLSRPTEVSRTFLLSTKSGTLMRCLSSRLVLQEMRLTMLFPTRGELSASSFSNHLCRTPYLYDFPSGISICTARTGPRFRCCLLSQQRPAENRAVSATERHPGPQGTFPIVRYALRRVALVPRARGTFRESRKSLAQPAFASTCKMHWRILQQRKKTERKLGLGPANELNAYSLVQPVVASLPGSRLMLLFLDEVEGMLAHHRHSRTRDVGVSLVLKA